MNQEITAYGLVALVITQAFGFAVVLFKKTKNGNGGVSVKELTQIILSISELRSQQARALEVLEDARDSVRELVFIQHKLHKGG